jgi:DNA-binding transcriptional MerR regulator
LDKSPDAFRTISEVADDLDLPQHVLRFWETRFAQIRPLKRGGGRRYYRPDDVALLRGIKHLLYGEGYTIRGVQRILRDHGPKHVVALSAALADRAPARVDAAVPAGAGRREPVFDEGVGAGPPEPADSDADEQAAPAPSATVQEAALAEEWPQAVLTDADLAPDRPPAVVPADEPAQGSDDVAEPRRTEPSLYAPRPPAAPAQAVPASERRLSYAAVRSLEAVLDDLIECRALLGRET